MEPSSVRSLFATLLCLFLFNQTQATNFNFNTDEIRNRVQSMSLIVKPKYNSTVEGYIKKYLSNDGGLAKRILGRSAIYFPIFDNYLKEHKMPLDLKYLAIVESALVPKATSPVGAGGLWQFMAETGRGFGLTINGEMDERACTHNSTQAAMKYLARLYERYNKWELALAAYNCGTGNINRAIKRARTEDYWVLSNYLSRETRNFVPAFIGAAYIGNYYHLHDIEPNLPNLDMQLTEAIPVFDKIDFETIAAVTHLPVEIIAELNQSFKKRYVPENPNGYLILLPKRVVPAFKEYLSLLRPDAGTTIEMPEMPAPPDSIEYMSQTYYFQSTYTVAEGDNLDGLASLFNCSPYHLKIWNSLISNQLKKGQDLNVWFPKEQHHFLPQPEKIEVEPEDEKTAQMRAAKLLAPPKKIAVLKTEVIPEIKKPATMNTSIDKVPQGYQFYQLHRNETLIEVAQKFSGVTVKDLMEWNGFTKNNMPTPGTKLIIKTK